MEGLNQHLEFQVKLAGGGPSSGDGGSSPRSYGKMAHIIGETPDDIADIGSVVPIQRVN